jgi:hypothetical protein
MRYFIITYFKKPSGQMDEQNQVTRRIKTRDLQCANVILDFKKLEVVKCSMNGVNVPRDFDRIVQYYMQYYENILTRLFQENGWEIAKPEKATDEKESTENTTG